MKIWLDTTLMYGQTSKYEDGYDECRDDDDSKDCRILASLLLPSIVEEHMQYSYTQKFRQSSSLYFQQCQNDYWLICDPIGTGQVMVVDAEALALLGEFHNETTLYEVMQQNRIHSASEIERLVTLFYKAGFLQNAEKIAETRKRGVPETLMAWLHVTNACNLRCQYCYIEKTSEYISEDTAYKSIDAIFRSAKSHNFKAVRLKYAGGEASLLLTRVIEVHDYAIEEAKKYGLMFRAHIHSNGVMIAQRAIDQLKPRNIGVTISLDGLDDYHDNQRPFSNGSGSFKFVDRTITRLLDSGVVPHINITVSQRNLDGLPALIDYILQREMLFTLSYYRDNECSTHIRDLQFSDAQMIAGMRDVFAHIEQNLPKRCLLGSLIDKANLSTSHTHPCGVGRNYLVIDQNGGVAKCHADIRRRVSTVHADDPLRALQDDREGVQGLSVEEKEGCRTCEWRYWCGGGCPLLTYRITGRYDIKSPNCNIYKALFPEALRLEALRLLKYETPITI
jgi:uncharacterized protein